MMRPVLAIKMNFTRIDDIVSWRLCTGCGACVAACIGNNVQLADMPDEGLRPVVDIAKCQNCGECVKVCPGINLSHRTFSREVISELVESWGPVLEVWEGYAIDPKIRYKGSSGGLATALALYSLERQNISGVLHVGTKPESPLRSVALFSETKESLLANIGSRYSPAAPCERLDWIQNANSSCVFIGKPCDVAALRKSQAANPKLSEKVHFAISIFCAGTPSTYGTKAILEALEVEQEQVQSFAYRGSGWPGQTVVTIKGNNDRRQMTYEQSWGNILNKHIPLRCRLCPDGTGEFADISCGDPWYREIEADDPGRSLVLVRTELGKEILRKAMNTKYVKLERVESSIIPRSQKALLMRRRHLWGRLLMLRIMRLPVPRYMGFSLFRNWLRLRVIEKLHSLGGTLKRIILRGLTKPIKGISMCDVLKADVSSRNLS